MFWVIVMVYFVQYKHYERHSLRVPHAVVRVSVEIQYVGQFTNMWGKPGVGGVGTDDIEADSFAVFRICNRLQVG
jgi:hypothetical protein